jgi:hypothetical protein
MVRTRATDYSFIASCLFNVNGAFVSSFHHFSNSTTLSEETQHAAPALPSEFVYVKLAGDDYAGHCIGVWHCLIVDAVIGPERLLNWVEETRPALSFSRSRPKGLLVDFYDGHPLN